MLQNIFKDRFQGFKIFMSSYMESHTCSIYWKKKYIYIFKDEFHGQHQNNHVSFSFSLSHLKKKVKWLRVNQFRFLSLFNLSFSFSSTCFVFFLIFLSCYTLKKKCRGQRWSTYTTWVKQTGMRPPPAKMSN